MFGVSFPELLVLGTVALLVLGPDKLPGMLRTMGQWVAKLRRVTTEVRYQSGIDEVLRAEGFDGGLNELRSVMRGGVIHPTPPRAAAPERFIADPSREYPPEGPDAYGALPEDLLAPSPPLRPTAALPDSVPAALPTSAPSLEPATPDAAAPERAPADAAASEKATSEKESSEKATSEKAASGKPASDRAEEASE